MPKIDPVHLDLELDGSPRTRCVVDYTITFDDLDQALNLEFRERCQLRGVDDGVTGVTQNIPNGLMRRETIRPNEQSSVTRHVEKVMSNADLNEDSGVLGFGTDEVIARVTLDPVSELFPTTITRNSNEVRHDF